jgi:DNA-directed RNA polymerase II subunit RPB1
MVGALINGGTGCFDLLLDHERVLQVLTEREELTDVPVVKKRTTVSDLIRKKKSKK